AVTVAWGYRMAPGNVCGNCATLAQNSARMPQRRSLRAHVGIGDGLCSWHTPKADPGRAEPLRNARGKGRRVMAARSAICNAALFAATALAGATLPLATAQAGGFALREQSAYFQGLSFAGAAAGGS